MVAAAQWGQHPPGNWCYGRSLVVDPWGTVIATASDGVGIVSAIVDSTRVKTVRRQIPSLANRRPEAYLWPEESVSLAGRLSVCRLCASHSRPAQRPFGRSFSTLVLVGCVLESDADVGAGADVPGRHAYTWSAAGTDAAGSTDLRRP